MFFLVSLKRMLKQLNAFIDYERSFRNFYCVVITFLLLGWFRTKDFVKCKTIFFVKSLKHTVNYDTIARVGHWNSSNSVETNQPMSNVSLNWQTTNEYRTMAKKYRQWFVCFFKFIVFVYLFSFVSFRAVSNCCIAKKLIVNVFELILDHKIYCLRSVWTCCNEFNVYDRFTIEELVCGRLD